ncbi:MAG TPA: phosphate ABC transporter substrate-binding protein PstS [Steroidobacteraceae bacterium]|nr:phosphate ABC transporter substrate-binding protein PstS [Steroidobacteraceae bacterium]
MNIRNCLVTSIIGVSIGLAALATDVSGAADISGAGATFPYPIYSKWADAYKKLTGIGLNYQSIGSGGGIKQIKAKTVTFGASDMPLKPQDLNAAGLLQFPMIIGGVVPVVNIKGVAPGALHLDGAIIAGIYMGEISNWNDPRIKKLNPGLPLPGTAIAPIYRSDGSGTNFLFSEYLSKESPKFASSIGANTSVDWPKGIGAKGNEGVANMTTRTDGAIGYVEYAYAKQNHMTYALLQNAAHRWVDPTAANFAAAAAGARWTSAPGFYLLLLNQPGANAWPITGATFILMHKHQTNAQAAHDVLAFFDWAYKNGNPAAESLDYVPLPDAVKALIRKSWVTIVGPNGKPVYP